jgi:hypothetical protein
MLHLVFLSKKAEGCSLQWQVIVVRPVMVLRPVMVHMAVCCCFFENIELYATLDVFCQKNRGLLCGNWQVMVLPVHS